MRNAKRNILGPAGLTGDVVRPGFFLEMTSTDTSTVAVQQRYQYPIQKKHVNSHLTLNIGQQTLYHKISR